MGVQVYRQDSRSHVTEPQVKWTEIPPTGRWKAKLQAQLDRAPGTCASPALNSATLGLPRTVLAERGTVPGTQFTWCQQLQAHFLPALQTQWNICLLPNVPAKAPELTESPSEGLPSSPEPVVGPEEPPLPSRAGLGHRPTTPRSSRLQARKEGVPQRNNRRWGPNHQRGAGTGWEETTEERDDCQQGRPGGWTWAISSQPPGAWLSRRMGGS